MFYIVCRADGLGRLKDQRAFSVLLNTYSESEEIYDDQRYDISKRRSPVYEGYVHTSRDRLESEELLAYNYTTAFFWDYDVTELFTGGWDEVCSRLVRNERLSADRS